MNAGTKMALVVGGILVALLVGVPLLWGGRSGWQSDGWGMMGPGMMGGFGWMGFGAVFMVVFWGVVIWAVVAFIQGSSHPGTWESRQQDSAVELLKRRYARGEINKEEYEEKKRDLA